MLPFSPDLDAGFDLTTYLGRYKHFQKIVSPINLFYSDSDLINYSKTLSELKAGLKKPELANEKLWNMKYACLASLHPELNQPLPTLFRTSAFVPVNIPMVIGLSILPPTPINQFFAQTLNQTYNFAFNYANRNASNVFSSSQLTFSYLAACSCAIGASIGLSKFFGSLNLQASLKTILIRSSPFLGVASANVCNLLFSRFKDFSDGIQVMDPNTKEYINGKKSVIAAKKAFWQTALTRVLIPIPIFFIPNAYLMFLTKKKLISKSKLLNVLNYAAISAFSLYIGLSGAIAIFPQFGIINSEELESDFHNILDQKGNRIEKFAFNKGL